MTESYKNICLGFTVENIQMLKSKLQKKQTKEVCVRDRARHGVEIERDTQINYDREREKERQ